MLTADLTCWVCNPVCRCSGIPEVGRGSPGCCCSDDGRWHTRPPLDSEGRTSCCFSGGKHLHSHLRDKNGVEKHKFRWIKGKTTNWPHHYAYFSPSSPPCRQRPAPFPPRVAHQPHWGLAMHWEHWVSWEHWGVQESPPESSRPHWPASHRRGMKDGLMH